MMLEDMVDAKGASGYAAARDAPVAAQSDPRRRGPAVRSLEDLPFEIQRLIISQAPTFDTLRALVHASPQLHRVYAQDRPRILREFVQQTLGGALIDAHAAYLSGRSDFQRARDLPMLWEFVDAYQRRLRTMATPDLVARLSLEDIIPLVRFHDSVVEPLTERYAIWALAALSSSPRLRPLSGTERRRIQRALYRLQVFCNLCGSRGVGHSSPNNIADEVDRLRVLCLFPAWQIEEILCVHTFAEDVYGGLFHQVAWVLDEARNQRYAHINKTAVNEDLLLFSTPECILNHPSLEHMLRHGPILLSSALKTTHHDDLVRLVREGILSIATDFKGSYYPYEWIDDAVSDMNQEDRRNEWYSEEDAAQDRRDKTPFVMDTPDAPPLAWVTFWKGEASNLFGAYVPQTFRRWGYVMWDAPRLEASGALEYMRLEDPYRSWSHDPREPNYLEEDSGA